MSIVVRIESNWKIADYLGDREIGIFFQQQHTLINCSEGHKRSWCRFAFDGHCVARRDSIFVVGVNGNWDLKKKYM